jgi:hypothetical protein
MLIVGAPRARASKAELEISSGGAIEFVPSVFGHADFGGRFIEGWNIVIGHAVTFSLPGSTDLMELKGWLRCAASPCNRDPLKLTLSGTGFTTPVHLFRNISSVNYMTVGMTKTQEAFWDASNGLSDKTSSISTALSFTGPIAAHVMTASGGGAGGSSPFSLTAVSTFTANSTGTGPEPSMLLLFGSGLLLFGTIARKLLRAKREISA